ncbi:MAG: thioredoxin domain-containing protein [Acidobacteriota bacterium]
MSTDRKPARATLPPGRHLGPWLLSAAAFALVLALAGTIVFSQSPDEVRAILKEIEALRQGQAAIQKELQELKALLQRQPGAQPAPRPTSVGKNVLVAGRPFKGREDAPLTIVEFSDFQCPFCARYVTQTLPQIDREYIQTGKVKYVFRNLPLESIHKQAFKAAESAECALAQGRFWDMHARLFANQTKLMADQLQAHADALGLGAAFQRCLASGMQAAHVRQDVNDATQLGITGTPAFLVGRTKPGDPGIQVLAFISGAKPFAAFKDTLDQALASR